MNKVLIVGLGNIGEAYNSTRHNIGFDVVDYFAYLHKSTFSLERHALRCLVKIKNTHFVCIKPTTYMNLSGTAFKYWLEKEAIPLEKSLTVVDDLAIPLHKIKIKPSGSDAGHNGLKDIQLKMATDIYPKLRFGIGNNFPKGTQVNFVLGKWLEAEIPIVRKKIESSCEAIELFGLENIEKAMNFINKIDFTQ